jgi:hypothetical protein
MSTKLGIGISLDNNFDKALTTYYKLKKQYQKQFETEFGKIERMDGLTNKEKHEHFNNMKKKCVNCGNTGGTIFSNKNNTLSARCGHLKNPCKLNIELHKAVYIDINRLIDDLNYKININKNRTITTKLNFLFGFNSETTTINNFNKLKTELIEEVKKYQKYNELYLDIINPSKELTTKKKDLVVFVSSFKDLIKNYEVTQDAGHIKDAIDLYINSMNELVIEIRNLKYSYNKIETDDNDMNYLIQQEYTQSQLQIPLPNTQNKIISFKR